MMKAAYYSTLMESPVGQLLIVASERGICGLYYTERSHAQKILQLDMQEGSNHPLLMKACAQLSEYFAGKRQKFDLPLDMQGTVFQIKAWRELAKIPYGQTISYGEQANRMGDSKKARAAGIANGRNPVSIIVPCHRVVGASGALTGYAGGIGVKEKLLELESKTLASAKPKAA